MKNLEFFLDNSSIKVGDQERSKFQRIKGYKHRDTAVLSSA
jgi:hypothetical protein